MNKQLLATNMSQKCFPLKEYVKNFLLVLITMGHCDFSKGKSHRMMTAHEGSEQSEELVGGKMLWKKRHNIDGPS